MRRHVHLLLASLAAMAFLLAACGGGSASDGASTDDGGDATTTTAAETTVDSTFGLDPVQAEFEEADGVQARFVNMLVVDGEPTDIDVYWGFNADTGKKAVTVPYGEATEYLPVELTVNSFVDDSTPRSIEVAFYLAGETDQDSLIINKSETIDGEMALTFAMGWTDDEFATIPGSLSVGFDHEAGAAPDGQAWFALNTVGVGGIDGGDFMVPNGPDGCGDLTASEIEGGTANSGQAYVLDPGSYDITASDANTDCSFKTPPATLELAAGDRYVLFAYGSTLEDRQLLALPLTAP